MNRKDLKRAKMFTRNLFANSWANIRPGESLFCSDAKLLDRMKTPRDSIQHLQGRMCITRNLNLDIKVAPCSEDRFNFLCSIGSKFHVEKLDEGVTRVYHWSSKAQRVLMIEWKESTDHPQYFEEM